MLESIKIFFMIIELITILFIILEFKKNNDCIDFFINTKELPDLNNYDTSNITNMNSMFKS